MVRNNLIKVTNSPGIETFENTGLRVPYESLAASNGRRVNTDFGSPTDNVKSTLPESSFREIFRFAIITSEFTINGTA